MILVGFASLSFARYVASPRAVSEAAFSARIVKDYTPRSTHAADTHADAATSSFGTSIFTNS